MPTPDKVTRALETIAKSTANYEYFFRNLKSPTWLTPLAERGRFRIPPTKVDVEGGVIFPGWPESQYLARMAHDPAAQQQVLQIVADSGGRRKGFRGERENDSGVKTNRIPG
jgi:hypothetical protein